MPERTKPRVVVVGGGFGGLNAARALRHAPAEVVLLDQKNHHLFQPLLYQVATAALSPGNIATPLRKVFERQANCAVYLGKVESIDLDGRRIVVGEGRAAYGYDYLVLAAGVRTAYFRHDEWAARAPGLKTIDDAIELRRRYLLAFEHAELEIDADARRRVLTFAIVGAGPTGVEMAGAMAELARQTMRRSFRRLDTRETRVILIDGNERVLSSFPPRLSARAERDLRRLGVEVRLGERVVEVAEDGLTLESARGGRTTIKTPNIVWAAGVEAVPLASTLVGVELDRAGRVKVNADLSIPGHPEAFVVGDLASVADPVTGQPVPGVAQGAIQMGRFAGRTIAREIANPPPHRGGGKAQAQREPGGGASETPSSLRRSVASSPPSPPRPAFRYRDKGELATIGRARAVANLGPRLRFAGFPAWLLWATIHIMYLINFRSRLLTMLEWIWLYFFYDRGVRLITGPDALPHPARPPRDSQS